MKPTAVCYTSRVLSFNRLVPARDLIVNHMDFHLSRNAKYVGLLVGVSTLTLTAAMTAFGSAPSTITFSGHFQEVVEKLGAPVIQQVADEEEAHARELRLQPGDTVATLFSKLGIRDSNAMEFLRGAPEAQALFKQLAPGKTLTAKVSADGELQALVFPLNGGKNNALSIERTAQGFNTHVQDLQVDSRISLQTAIIRHSLFGAADDAGIPDSVAVQLADIFGGDIDFHRDLRKGDQFSVIYQSISYLGKPVRAERILAAELINDGKPYRAFWYQAKDGSGGYYTEQGQNIKKAFLRSPLEFSRITSGFSAARYHPVLQEIRAHRGIDYGAPTGTRVKATGDGKVDFVGSQGGYGKVVVIRHAGDKTTVYGHLSRFSPDIRKGTRVAQGDVIGFVGATGLATGPHLHYEFRVSGVHRNPLAMALPNATPLPQAQIPAFRAHVNELSAQLQNIGDLKLVKLD